MKELTEEDLIRHLRAQYGSLAAAAKELQISVGSLYALKRAAHNRPLKKDGNRFTIMCKVAEKLGYEFETEQKIYLLTKTL